MTPAPAGHATGPWLLHALVNSAPPLPPLPRPDLCRTDIRHGPGAGLSILLTPIGAAGAARLAEADGAAELAVAHHALLAALAPLLPLLPVRFPALCDSPLAAVQSVTARGAGFRALIDRLGDGAEYGLRILAPAPGALPAAEAEPVAGGSAWLRAAATRRQARAGRGAAQAGLITRAVEALAALASATAAGRPPGMLPDGRRRLADCAFLVPRAATEGFLAMAAGVAAQLGAAGLLADLSGPWPAYSFSSPEGLA